MATQAGSLYYIAFYAGVGGLVTSDFDIIIFTNNGTAVDSNTRSSLAIVEVGFGFYYVRYNPSSAGLYYLGLSNVANAINIANSVDIKEATFAVNLTQDTGGVDNLKPNFVGITLSEYLLMVFDSGDWQVGRTDNTYAAAMTGLDDEGNWLATPLVISPGTYHIIIRNNFGSTISIATFLEV